MTNRRRVVGWGTACALAFTAIGCAAGSNAGEQGTDGETLGAAELGASSGSVEGCYRFVETAGSDALGLPWGVALMDEPLGAGWPLMDRYEDVHVARAASSRTGRSDVPFGYWRPVAGDSVEIGHPGGGGVTLVVEPRANGLVGRGRSAGDALQPGQRPGPRPSRPVLAERFSCP